MDILLIDEVISLSAAEKLYRNDGIVNLISENRIEPLFKLSEDEHDIPKFFQRNYNEFDNFSNEFDKKQYDFIEERLTVLTDEEYSKQDHSAMKIMHNIKIKCVRLYDCLDLWCDNYEFYSNKSNFYALLSLIEPLIWQKEGCMVLEKICFDVSKFYLHGEAPLSLSQKTLQSVCSEYPLIWRILEAIEGGADKRDVGRMLKDLGMSCNTIGWNLRTDLEEKVETNSLTVRARRFLDGESDKI